MKIRPYVENPTSEKVVCLRLKTSECGKGVTLCAVNCDGGSTLEGGYILTITVSGRLLLNSSVSKELGFDLDKYNRIKLT